MRPLSVWRRAELLGRVREGGEPVLEAGRVQTEPRGKLSGSGWMSGRMSGAGAQNNKQLKLTPLTPADGFTPAESPGPGSGPVLFCIFTDCLITAASDQVELIPDPQNRCWFLTHLSCRQSFSQTPADKLTELNILAFIRTILFTRDSNLQL